MPRVLAITLGFSLGILACWPAMADATLQVVKGKVSVNQGQGFKQVAAGSAVSTGDRVMADPNSRAKIVYADGCAVDVYPGAVVTVPDKCYEPMRAGLEAPVEQPFPWVPVLGAAAVIGVGACAVSGCFNGEEHHHQRTPEGGNNGD